MSTTSKVGEPGKELQMAAVRRQGYIKGAKDAVLKMQELLHEKEDKAACSVSIYDVDDIVGEVLRMLEDESDC